MSKLKSELKFFFDQNLNLKRWKTLKNSDSITYTNNSEKYSITALSKNNAVIVKIDFPVKCKSLVITSSKSNWKDFVNLLSLILSEKLLIEQSLFQGKVFKVSYYINTPRLQIVQSQFEDNVGLTMRLSFYLTAIFEIGFVVTSSITKRKTELQIPDTFL